MELEFLFLYEMMLSYKDHEGVIDTSLLMPTWLQELELIERDPIPMVTFESGGEMQALHA